MTIDRAQVAQRILDVGNRDATVYVEIGVQNGLNFRKIRAWHEGRHRPGPASAAQPPAAIPDLADQGPRQPRPAPLLETIR